MLPEPAEGTTVPAPGFPAPRPRAVQEAAPHWRSSDTAASGNQCAAGHAGGGSEAPGRCPVSPSLPPWSESHRRGERTPGGPGASAPLPAPCPAAHPLRAWHTDPKLRAGSPPPGTATARRPRSSQDRLPGRSGWPPWGPRAELTRRKDCPAPGPRFPSVSLS